MPSLAQWEALNPRYHARLESAGYTREDYLANRSRKWARGHRHTPERPERAYKHPERYQEYLERHPPPRGGGIIGGITHEERGTLFDRRWDELVQLLQLGKRLGGIDKLDRMTLEYAIFNAPPTLFRYMETLTIEQWRDFGRTPFTGPGSDQWEGVEILNPFFYH